jgi:hypothetical protein
MGVGDERQRRQGEQAPALSSPGQRPVDPLNMEGVAVPGSACAGLCIDMKSGRCARPGV